VTTGFGRQGEGQQHHQGQQRGQAKHGNSPGIDA
jgi:hypothetical protein